MVLKMQFFIKDVYFLMWYYLKCQTLYKFGKIDICFKAFCGLVCHPEVILCLHYFPCLIWCIIGTTSLIPL